MNAQDKLVVMTLVGLMSVVGSAHAEDKAGSVNTDSNVGSEGSALPEADGAQLYSVQTFTLDQQDANAAPIRCTVSALVPQGTPKKLAFRGEYQCTGTVDVSMILYEEVAYDSGTSGEYYIQMPYLTGQSSGGYTAYEMYVDTYGPGIVSTKVEVVACLPSGGCSTTLVAQSSGVHLN